MPGHMPLVAIRVDCSAAIGLGHVTRCLALAEALIARGVDVEFLSAALPSEVAASIDRVGAARRTLSGDPGGEEDALELVRVAPDLAVVDGYGFGPAFFSTLAGSGCSYAVVDDNGETTAAAPVMVVNQNPSATAGLYRHLPGQPRLLLGLDYVMLRDGIRRADRREADDSDGRALVVSIGGSDPSGITAPLANELAAVGIPVEVAVGAANPRSGSLAEQLRLMGVDVIDPSCFVESLASASIAVIGAGSTMWEAAFLGVPAIAVVVAHNQVGPAAAAEELGFVCSVEQVGPDTAPRVRDLVEKLLADRDEREAMSNLGRCHVDGAGADRVAAEVVAALGVVA